jgi:hypothetical protein
MHKIKRASFFFRILFQTIFCILPVLLAIFWIIAPTPLGFPAHGFDIIILISWIMAEGCRLREEQQYTV